MSSKKYAILVSLGNKSGNKTDEIMIREIKNSKILEKENLDIIELFNNSSFLFTIEGNFSRGFVKDRNDIIVYIYEGEGVWKKQNKVELI